MSLRKSAESVEESDAFALTVFWLNNLQQTSVFMILSPFSYKIQKEGLSHPPHKMVLWIERDKIKESFLNRKKGKTQNGVITIVVAIQFSYSLTF